MVATTKTVVGNVNNLSAGGLGTTTMLFDLDPAYVVVSNDIIVGAMAGGVKGEPVTPDPTTGAFSVALVAVDSPTWTITVTITGTGVETPISISIVPPPAAGTGSVNFADLIVASPSGSTPVLVNTLRGAADYDNTVAPTTSQAIVWNGTKYHPATVSGGGSGLPAGGSVGQNLYKNSSTDGDASWQTPPSSFTQSQGDVRYAPIIAGLPILAWNGTAYPAKPVGVTNGFYQGPAAQDPGGANGDVWAQTS
jgi:hypothetical protein